MAEFRIKMTSFVILLLQCTVTGQTVPSVTAGAGDEVTLPCNNVIKDQDKCNGTTWIASRSGETTVELIEHGKISNNLLDKDKSDRLSVTENCSLVIRNITVEDSGRYTCRQFNRSGQQQDPDAVVLLSVVTMTGDKVNDVVTLFCYVSTYRRCEHTVKWLYEGNKTDVETTPLGCSARVIFPTLHLNQKSNYYELLKCSVTDERSGETLLFNASLQFSCEKTGGCTSAGKNDTSSAKNDTPQQGRLWLYILVAVGLAVLLAVIIVVVVIRRKRTKGNQTQMDKNMRLTSNPAVTPETNDDTADPEDGVSYASVSYTKKTNSKAKVWGKGDDDEGEAVTYSTVKASSSSPPAAGASADLSDLFATVNKPDK
ncbi:uncharacterized protein LOC119476804 isoform X4 [Sebastes umbrosus]|uniref:uncharacterized protein LOC119476804 isoform X3 n=1 Tax=Sebastes umbrosus TaxID=72105 RepID=UPI00189EF196|nr:uncharacterized protein LOC119476804 isoform X3 [Sebastes umbrosus]XP_037606280.1 uncharacterized protein LOC119476804 isoform X4 [Sebastes umbrosus]